MSDFDPVPNEQDQGGAGWQDLYRNYVAPERVEEHGPIESFEDALISEMEVLELLKSLPEMQRLAIEKRMKGIPLDAAERKALERAKPTVTKWIEIRSQY